LLSSRCATVLYFLGVSLLEMPQREALTAAIALVSRSKTATFYIKRQVFQSEMNPRG
jgi:hypothetical protein